MARHLFLIRGEAAEHLDRDTEQRELVRRRQLVALRTTRERHRFADPQQQLLDDVHARRYHDAA